jgi:prophage regulatory protein
MNVAITPLPTKDPAAPSQVGSKSRLIPLEEVMTRCGMGRTAVYSHIKKGSFPAPVKIGTSSRWLSTEVDAWIAAIVATRPPAPASATAAA